MYPITCMNRARPCKPRLALLTLLATTLLACNGESLTTAPPDEDPREGVTPAMAPAPLLPDSPLPDRFGLFWVQNTGAQPSLHEIERGDPLDLHPTNADRGFGFVRPIGTVLDQAQPLLVLWTGTLNPATLRLTRFAPEAILPPRWWEKSREGFVGWLPASIAPIVSERLEDHPGMMRLQPAVPLTPGFYAIHDGGLIRGRQRADVQTFFPFRIARADDPPGDAAWYTQTNTCLQDLENRLFEACTIDASTNPPTARLDHRAFARTHADHLRRCAVRFHALMSAVDDEHLRLAARTALFALDALAHEPDWQATETLYQSLKPGQEGAALLWFWLEWTLLDRIITARTASAGGDIRLAEERAAPLAKLYFMPTGNPQRPQPGALISELAWVPFVLDPQWPELARLTALRAEAIDAHEEILTLLAAHRLKRLQRLPQLFPEARFIPLLAPITASLPADIQNAAQSLDLDRAQERSIALGPLIEERTDNAPPMPAELKTLLDEWFRARRKNITRCYERLERRLGEPVQGLVLARVESVASFWGTGAKTEILAPDPNTPFDTFGDEAFMACLRDEALSGLPADAAGFQTRFLVAIAFSGHRQTSLWFR